MVDPWKYTNKLGGKKSPGEKFKRNWLSDLPKKQWAAYIDESAKVIIDPMAEVGETELTPDDFPKECGEYYKQGLITVSGNYSDLSSTVEGLSSADRRIGEIALELNELEMNLSESDSIDIQEKGRAVEAVLNKILVHKADRFNPVEISRNNLSPSEMAIEILDDPTVAEYSETILTELGKCVNKGLIHKLDEPQMTTQLWGHQLDSLEQWVKSGRRGYVDMATATGKTVLGLATIAYDYGELHPKDEERIDKKDRFQSDNAKVLVVADRGLILEQWKDEFDSHLNIPPERTKGEDTIKLDWGEVHFRTTKQLLNNPVEEYDLVILDEAHHYATGSGWGELLEEFNNDVLALSGSIDEGEERDGKVRRTLNNHFDEVGTYTLKEAREDGIIPDFEWNIVYAGFEEKGSLNDVTERCRSGFEQYAAEMDISDSNIDLSTSDSGLITYTDILNYSSTTEGKELKETDEGFKKFVSSLFSRRTSIWNLSPDLGAVSDLASEYAGSKKCLVLVRSREEVEEVQKRIRLRIKEEVKDNIKGISTTDTDKQNKIIEEFREIEAGVLVGTGSLIGEGIDIPHAEVGINVDDGGGVNNTLLQRIGRVLRNPDGKDNSEFYNVAPVPIEEESTVPQEDGKDLIEDAAQYRSLGSRIERRPGYVTFTEEARSQVELLEKSGIDMIEKLVDAEIYDYPEGDVARELIEKLLQKPRNHPMILDEFSADTAPTNILTEMDSKGNQPKDDTTTEGNGTMNGSERDVELDKSATQGVVEVSEVFDDPPNQDHLLEIGDERITLKEVRQSIFKDREVLSSVDSLTWDNLPVSVRMQVVGIRSIEEGDKKNIVLQISDIQNVSDDLDSYALLTFGEEGIYLEQEKQKLIDEGTSMVKIEEVSWGELPLTNLDIEVTQINENDQGELVFRISNMG